MSVSNLSHSINKTTTFFVKLNKVWYVAGLPNLWVADEHNKKIFKKIYKYFHRMITLCLFIFIILEFGAFFTQSHLTDKQSTDLLLFNISHPILIAFYLGIEYHKTRVKDLFKMLHTTLKNIYNDPYVETRMIRKASFVSIIYLVTVCTTLISYGFNGVMQFVISGGSFTTVVTAWPDVEDYSLSANLGRVIIYIIWWVFMARVSAVSILTIMTSVALSHQYKNLQSYFNTLNDIFQTNADEIEQKENELKYIEALKVGIKLHSNTLWCTRQFQVTFSLVYSGQIIINISVLCLLMLQMVNSERSLTNGLTIICTSIAVLTSTGFLMWNAGDITVEAALVPTSIYSSGWHNCRGTTSARVRNLLSLAMMQGQEHVVLRSFGIVEISYKSYLSIVKSSYSVFSLLY